MCNRVEEWLERNEHKIVLHDVSMRDYVLIFPFDLVVLAAYCLCHWQDDSFKLYYVAKQMAHLCIIFVVYFNGENDNINPSKMSRVLGEC